MSFVEGTPTVTVKLDKERELGFTIGAMKRLKALGLLDVNVEDQATFLLSLPTYVWASLDQEGRKELKLEAIEELIHPRNAREIAQALWGMIGASLPEKEPDEGNLMPPAESQPTGGEEKSTSTNSGPLACMTSD